MPTPTVVLLLLACARWYGACPCPARCARSCLLACRARASSCRHLARLPLLFEFVRRCRPAVRVSRRCWLRAALCGCAEDSGVALLCVSGLKNLHTLRRFARRGARACGRPFCARPFGSSCSGRGGGVQAAGSQASSSWRRRASLGATPVAQCARTRCSARSRACSAATSRHVEPQPHAPRRRPRALCPPLASARWSTACCSRSEATATADATS